MSYRANPFSERMSERTTSDQEFVRLFSPKILEHLSEDCFSSGVTVFRSPPGGGKTTLLRAFTPSIMRAFMQAAKKDNEAYQQLKSYELIDDKEGPKLLGVFLSCAAGYADLPPGASTAQSGLFRALVNCRIVLRALRSLASLIGSGSIEQLEDIVLAYDESLQDLQSIPLLTSPRELISWAEECERRVYDALDDVGRPQISENTSHLRFDGILWLQSVQFIKKDGRPIILKRLLMVDDVQKLRKTQRKLLLQELVELRTLLPIWLAERSSAIGDELLSPGAREDRDLRFKSLQDLWQAGRGNQFSAYAQNILDRRLANQNDIPQASFFQHLHDRIAVESIQEEYSKAKDLFLAEKSRLKNNVRYSEWLAHAEQHLEQIDIGSLIELYSLRILVARDESKKQFSFDLAPLTTDELLERDSSSVQAAAEIFIHEALKIPYYFGIDRLCNLATYNIEELLSLAASLFEALQAKYMLRKQSDKLLNPKEQEKRLLDVARKKYLFIPKTHTEGTRAQTLIDAIGRFCRDKTFQPNAPIAPGVTGIRLSFSEIEKLEANKKTSGDLLKVLRVVLSECVAENLFFMRDSAATTGRSGGKVFYLNRTLCAHYGLPLNIGGWQDVSAEQLNEWLERGYKPKQRQMEIN